MTTTVFLHIPKTAGQTIHSELSRIVGEDKTSPVRVHTQAAEGVGQYPPGYDLYSGHLDWDALETLPEDRFVFTVLRDPCERIASFYFYLLKQAQGLTEEELQHPHRQGMNRIRNESADSYFFGGDRAWQVFVRDHYDNVYCSYFATRRMRGWRQVETLSTEEKIAAAKKNLPLVDRIYSTLDLGALEKDVEERLGQQISVVGKYVNRGEHATDELRWPKLLERIESDANLRKLEQFVAADEQLLFDLGIRT
jgi:hypothetical protein